MPLDLIKLNYLNKEINRPFQIIQSEVVHTDPMRIITCSSSTYIDIESTLELVAELIDVDNDLFVCSTKGIINQLQKYLNKYDKKLKYYVCNTSGRNYKTVYNTAYMLEHEYKGRMLSSNFTANTIVRV